METFLGESIRLLVGLGLYDVILPFIFVFTIIFVLLENQKLLGQNRKVHAMVAFCIGFIATASLATVEAINTFFAATGFFMVAGFCVMLLAAMFGATSLNVPGDKWWSKIPKVTVFLTIGLTITYLSLVAFGVADEVLAFIPSLSSVLTGGVIVGAVFILLIWFIIRPSKSGVESSSSSTEKKQNKKDSKSDDKKDDRNRSGDEGPQMSFKDSPQYENVFSQDFK